MGEEGKQLLWQKFCLSTEFSLRMSIEFAVESFFGSKEPEFYRRGIKKHLETVVQSSGD